MYIKINQDGTKSYPYSFLQLKRDNPGMSYPSQPTEAALASYGLFTVTPSTPQYDEKTHRVEEAEPHLVDGEWVQSWDIIPLTVEELTQREAKRVASLDAERAYAYRMESDALFFKAHRGEATMQEWLDKVAEIKARFNSEGA